MTNSHRLFPALPASRPTPLAAAIRTLFTGGLLFGVGIGQARAELPVPAEILVVPGAGNVLPPSVSGNTMTIRQLSDKATLDWQSFNIGRENTVEFQQPSATAIALNRIHQADPSRIYGRLTANGQVYLVNQNGFVFGRGSTVNVNSLVATTLNISEETFRLGITQAFDQNKQAALSATDAAGQPVQQLYLKDADGRPVLDGNGNKVKIQILIEPGARIGTQGRDGRIILAAPAITNQGRITAPDGQAILAASQDKVYLQQADADSDIRGVLVEVGTGGSVDNLGQIVAERGNASLIGFAVNQQGLVSATTSVKLNGSVRLLAREGVRDPLATEGALRPAATRRAEALDDGLGRSAAVTLAKGSVSGVELSADKAETAVDAAVQARSKVEIAGHRILAQNGATVRAKSGEVRLDAVDDPANPLVRGNARIHLDRGSRIDVSGVRDVSLPMERNVVKVELRSNELRDSPLQRNGVLHGKTVAVDVRKVDDNGRIPIADVSGALDRIERNIDERSTDGGTIELASSGDVIARRGSELDFSGGSVAYRGGYVETTQLGAGNRIFDIAEADPNRRYDRIVGDVAKNYRKWGVTDTWAQPAQKRFEPGYVEGKAGGELDIAAFEAELDGILKGQTLAGPYQRAAADRAPGSSLAIDLNRNSLQGKQDVALAPHRPAGTGPADPFPAKAADSAESRPLALDPGLFQRAGIGHVAIRTNGSLRIEAGSRVQLPENGSLDLAASGFEVEGSILAPSGKVTLAPATFQAEGRPVALPSAIRLGPAARILAGGEWVNDLRDRGNTSTVALDGGHVNLRTEQGDLTLEPGSRIDVSGGAWLQRDSRLLAGTGGSITLTAATELLGAAPSSLLLEGQLTGFGLEQGGSLSLTTNEVLIGDGFLTPDPSFPNLAPLVLAPDFFRTGGFGDFSISSNYRGVAVAEGTAVEPLQVNRILPGNVSSIPSRSGILGISRATVLPGYDRKPANLALAMAQQGGHDRSLAVRVGTGARIETDPAGRIALSSDTSVIVDGTLKAPGGTISLAVNLPGSVDSGFFESQGIWLGSSAELLAPGAFLREPDGTGLITGEVLPGGTISLSAARGYIVTDRFSSIDVSGTSATLQFREPGTSDPGLRAVSREIPSAGGAVRLAAGEGIIADGTLRASAGGPGVGGGSFSAELSGQLRVKPPEPVPGGAFPDDANPLAARYILVSSAFDPFAPADLALGGDIPSALYSGRGLLGAGSLNAGGFAALSLKTDAFFDTTYTGSIRFQGDVQLSAGREIVLDAPTLGWQPAADAEPGSAGTVSLAAPRVALGSTLSRIDQRQASGAINSTLAPAPTSGDGRLSVSASGVDLVGGLSFDGLGQVEINSTGDTRAIGIRTTSDTKDYLGELRIAGNLAINARQIYPTTLTDYAITASGSGAGISLGSSGAAPTPVYSAGGSLRLAAPDIVQGGVLKAPFGTLALNAGENLQLAAGSLTSVSGSGLTVPFGRGSGGLNWLYPLDAAGINNRVIAAPPEKRISLAGPSVDLAEGAAVDLSGGGDLYGYEFITGPGGTRDVLDASDAAFTPKFAVIPGVYGVSTPYDPAEFPASRLRSGDSVYLGAAAGLPAGWYTLLPAHYALLPGAYLVTPEAGTRDIAAGMSYTRLDGSTVVAGRYGVAGTPAVDPRWQGFAVEPGAIARTRSEFQDYSANAFFAAKAAKEETAAPQLPRDAGSLAISADTSLALRAGVAAAAASGGAGGEADISASRLAVLARSDDLFALEAGAVGLLAEDLNRLNVESLLLGGLRSREPEGRRLRVVAGSVRVAGEAQLKGSEILLAATDRVAVESGATVESVGTSESPADDLLVSNRVASGAAGSSDGALLRLSSRGQVDVTRDAAVAGSTGTLVVEPGATLRSEGSMLLDSTRDTRFAGTIVMDGGSLALKSSRISIGDAPGNTPGLVLPDLGFSLDELRLASASELALYGGVAVTTRQLSIDAAAIRGYDNAGATSTITADSVLLSNTAGKATGTGNGRGELELTAGIIGLGPGDYAIDGFGQVRLRATEALLGQTAKDGSGTGRLTVGGDLQLAAGHIGGSDGSAVAIDATGHSVLLDALPAPAEPGKTTGLGAAWSITADAIAGTGRFDLPSGSLGLKALQGDVALGAGMLADVSGQARKLGTLARYTPAGSIRLQALKGNVGLADGATLNLSGAALPAGTEDPAGAAGSLAVAAPVGGFDWNGRITATASAGSEAGRFSLDAGSFGAGGLSALNGRLAEAGFTEAVELRQRRGDVVLPGGETIRAHRFELAADSGAVTIAGTVDASGPSGGEVSIQGTGGIRLAAGGAINARATADGAEGGRVKLDTVASGIAAMGSGLLDLSATASIDVGGGQGGTVHLRTGRNDASGQVNATAVNARISGSRRSVLEAARVYAGVATVNDAAIAGYRADTAAFMARAQAPADGSGGGLVLAPGLDIRNSGDLAFTGTWDFMAKDAASGQALWRYQGVPGYLRLAAGGNLDVRGSLSDGFATAKLPDPLYGTLGDFRFHDALQPVDSWSYSLAAGNDLRLAANYRGPNPLAPAQTVNRQVLVRTGTGSIDLTAGNDIRYLADAADPKAAAAVYTMGRPAQHTFEDLLLGRVPGFEPLKADEDLAAYLQRQDQEALAAALRWGTYGAYYTGYGFLAEYPTAGGDISLRAGGNIAGIQTGQMTTDWLVRSGTWNNDPADTGKRPTAWGINVSGSDAGSLTSGIDESGQAFVANVKGRRFFNQNLGALAGGMVSVRAGGDVRDLSVMVPTTGKPMGIVTTSRNGGRPNLGAGGATDTQWLANGTAVSGGGGLDVRAGGDIRGGEFYTGEGSGRLTAGGSIAAGGSRLGAVIGLGDSEFRLQARRDVVLGSALNPTLLPQQVLPDSLTRKNAFFFTYSPDGRLDLAATAGDVVLQSDVETLKALKGYTAQDGTGFEMAIYPGTLTATAAAGDIRIDDSLNLYPSARGQLELAAGGGIGSGREREGTLKVNLSDADPLLLPRVALPETGLLGDLPRKDYKTRERLDPESPVASVKHAATPVHGGDSRRAVLAAGTGDIAFRDGVQLKLFLPKSAEVRAGRDIRNLSVYAQNLAPDQITRIEAGRDLLFDSRLDANGGVIPLDQRLELAGPGRLQVVAGRDVNLGSSSGILTIGDLFNRALPDSGGASIDLLAGISDEVDIAGFMDKYLQPGGAYLAGIRLVDAEGKDPAANLTPEQKLAYIEGLPEEARLAIAQEVLFGEITRSAGAAAAAPESARARLYQRGFEAISTLFPGKDYRGDLALVFSQVKTLAGGGIFINSPGGKVDVGLAGTVGGIRKNADELGIVVQQQGNLNAYVAGNFNVNQSRVFTMGGGDIAIWSSEGDIDAGKGAKSAISAPPPITSIDEDGNIVTIFPPLVSGSGIQAISPADGSKAQGNVYLAAPKGIVNAGEAGISGGRVVIAATAVVGASNIQASGGTVGVPTAVAPPVVPAGVSGAAAGAAKAATESGGLDDVAKKEEQAANAGNAAAEQATAALSMLSTDVVGYGQCSVADVKSGKPECGGGSSAQ